MDEKTKLLMEETNCDQAEAELALQLTNYDLGKATSTLRTILRNIVVIKGKFIIETEAFYGLFVIILDKRAKNIVRLRCAVSYNPEVYEKNLSTDWYSTEKLTHKYRLQEGSVLSFANTIEKYFLQQIKSKGNMFYNAVNKMDLGLIQDILTKDAHKNFSKTQIIIEEINLEEFNPNRSTEINKTDTEKIANKLSQKDSHLIGDELTKVFLEVKLYEDKSGKLANSLSKGEIVLARIVDIRDVAGYLIRLLGAKEQLYLPVMIERIKRVDSGLELILHFTSGVYGNVRILPHTRVKVVKEVNIPWWKKILLTFYKKFTNKYKDEY